MVMVMRTTTIRGLGVRSNGWSGVVGRLPYLVLFSLPSFHSLILILLLFSFSPLLTSLSFFSFHIPLGIITINKWPGIRVGAFAFHGNGTGGRYAMFCFLLTRSLYIIVCLLNPRSVHRRQHHHLHYIAIVSFKTEKNTKPVGPGQKEERKN